MRRWNGWGDVRRSYPLPDSAAQYLQQRLGPGRARPDADFAEVVAQAPPSQLPAHPLISTNPAERLLHARGQSLPDWVALRSGQIGPFPDGVAYPEDSDQVRQLLNYAQNSGAHLIPYGGGTSVVGHINPLPGAAPTLTVDLSKMNALLAIDERSRLATFGAGVRGPDLERQLAAYGFTLGHFPQSFELSTLGGWIATRSSGQQSLYYGRIEDLFAGGVLESPQGRLKLPPLPASAAGPDLRQLVLGSEGRFGLLTEAIVRVQPLPVREAFYGAFFRSWQAGVAALQAMAQARLPVSMLRLSDGQETETTLALSGKERLVSWAERGLGLAGYGPGRSLLVYGVTGDRRSFERAGSQAAAAVRAYGGLPAGELIGNTWRKSRFYTPYLRNTLWARGYALDTLETALPWSSVEAAAAAIKDSLAASLQPVEERVLVFAHLSHVYADGASLYVTYLFRRADTADETLRRWQTLKANASQEVVRCGGTISHQHGVGLDHAPYLPAEKGALGMAALEAVRRSFDPLGLLNPGKLLPEAA